MKYQIEKLGAFGEGVAHDNGKVVFIKGALPGEIVEAKPTLIKKSFTLAKLTKVVSPCIDRVKPKCKYFGSCGGCSLQHLNYEAQLNLKRQTVEEALFKIGGCEFKVNEVVASPNIFRYRNKLSFPVRGSKVGLYEENSHNVVDIDDCLLQKEWNALLIKALRAFMRDYSLKGYDEKNGEIRHLVAREKDGSVCITLVTSSKIKIDKFIDYIPLNDFVLYQNVNHAANNVILSDEFFLIGGKGKYPDFHPASFYQVNDEIEARLYGDVLSECEGGTVIDAFCGAGNLSLMIAQKAKTVYGIEICRQAVDEAKERADKKGVFNIEFICGDCKEEFPRLVSHSLRNTTVVFDPPRKGLDENTLKAVCELAPEKIVYVSCNPATLARDLKQLSSLYEIQKLNVYDMFPQTVWEETLVVLTRKKNRNGGGEYQCI